MKLNKEDLVSLIKEVAGEVNADIARDSMKKGEAKRLYPDYLEDQKAKAEKLAKEKSGSPLGRYLRYTAQGRGDPNRVEEIAKSFDDEVVVKAVQATSFTAGGAAVPPDFRNEIIGLLKDRTVVRKYATSVPMPNGNLTMPFIDTGVTAYWVAESTNITEANPTYGQLDLRAHQLAAVSGVSNQYLQWASPEGDRALVNDMIRKMAEAEDLAFIRSAGLSQEPRGLRYWADSSNIVTSTSSYTTALATTELVDMQQKLNNQKVWLSSNERPYWIMNPRSMRYLQRAQNTGGDYPFKDEISGGTLFGYPVEMTTQIPITLGGTSNQSEVYLVAGEMTIVADSLNMSIQMFDGAAYYNGSSVVSGVSRNEQVIRIVSQVDFGCRHRGKEVAVNTEVKWGV